MEAPDKASDKHFLWEVSKRACPPRSCYLSLAQIREVTLEVSVLSALRTAKGKRRTAERSLWLVQSTCENHQRKAKDCREERMADL